MSETGKETTGCYKCGAPEGNSSRLCPECTKERKAQRKEESDAGLNAQLSKSLQGNGHPYGNPIMMAGIIAVIVGLSAYYMLFSIYGPGFGMSKADFMYKKCIHKMSRSTPPSSKPSGSETDKALANLGGEIANTLVSGVCEVLREECNKNATSPACKIPD